MNQPLVLILAACLLAALASTATAAPRAPVFGEARVASWSPRPFGLLAKREDGDATFYDAGLGACGATNSDADPIVALAAGLFGSKPGSSPFCGKCLSVTAGGKTLVLKVADKCPGCKGGSLDMTRAFFEKFYPLDKGRGPISWVEAGGCECLGDSPDCKGTAGKKAAGYPTLADSNASAAAASAAAAAAAAAELAKANVGSPVTISASTTSTSSSSSSSSSTSASTQTKADAQQPDAQYGKTQDAAKVAEDMKNKAIAAVTSPAASAANNNNNNNNNTNNNNNNNNANNANNNGAAPAYENSTASANQGGNAAPAYDQPTVNANQSADVQVAQVQDQQQSIESFSNGANQKWTQLLMQRAIDAARTLLRR
ncbi:hypothetical protein GGF32_005652 [Allomyces javanicus]|nr:hypothetical protein GGF32_005652 [Allomyces javanicus]